MTDEEVEYALGWLASVVRDLCDIEEQLTKAAFVKIARATANLLLASSAADEQMLDAREDAFAKENADVIRELWKRLHKDPVM